MIYLDTSIVLAQLLAEDRQPPATLWQGTLISSRLLEYEVWVNIHRGKREESHGELVRTTLARISYVELAVPVLQRVLEPFPRAVRTLDAIHLATALFVANQGQSIEFATYDQDQAEAARAAGVTLFML
jgi:predicted nucleic acid-binding protein